MKPKYKRLLTGIGIGIILSIAFLLVIQALKTNLIYYVKPSELGDQHINKTIRVGGEVRSWNKLQKTFIICDPFKEIPVSYTQMLPILFKENQEAVVEGIYNDGKLIAHKVFAKHDENYFPKETVERIKSVGQWKGK